MEYFALSSMARKYDENAEFQFVSVSCEASQNETFHRLMRETLKYFDAHGRESMPSLIRSESHVEVPPNA